mgnify:CR=1 FL=1
MKAQFDNRVMSSLLLFVDHQLLNHGEAYTNHSSYFTETNQTYANYFNYAAPFKQFVSDVSITGANVMTQVYLDGAAKNIGDNGFNSVDYLNGQVNFTSQITGANRLSGNYAVKDFNVYLTTLSEEEILFESKYHLKPKTNQITTGLAPDSQTFPAVFVKSTTVENVPFSFGGTDQTNFNARLIVLADSAYNLDAACSILKDVVKSNVFFIQDELPFNALGGYTGVAYNYTGLAVGPADPNAKTDAIFLNKAYVTKNVAGLDGYNKINPQMHTAFVDYELIIARNPRQFND